MITFTFKEIFPEYSDWKEFITSEGIVDYSKPQLALFDEFCYKILKRQYNNASIRYDIVEDFLSEISIIYRQKFNQFLIEKTLCDKLYSLTDEDIYILNEVVNNRAYNPNEIITDYKTILTYISEQNYNYAKGNKLEQYLKALLSIPSFNIFNFLKKQDENSMSFEDLFIQILARENFIFRG